MNSLSFKTALGWITVTDFDKKIIDFCLGKKKRIEANIEMVGTSLQ